MTKYVKSLKFSADGEAYQIRDAEQKSRLDTLEPQVATKADAAETASALEGKQAALVSGVNIKTINDQSILGSGNIVIQGGGSGGTTDYNDLTNKPQIAGTTLAGNKSAADLGLATTTDLAGKQDALPSTSGQEGKYLKVNGQGELSWASAGGGGGGTSDYVDLDNKPTINNVTLVGNKTSSDLGLASAEELAELIESSDPVDIVASATRHSDGYYISASGSVESASSWEIYGIENSGYNEVTYSCYNGGIAGLPMVAFYSSSTLSPSTLVGVAPAATTDSLNTGTVSVPAGTTYIVLSNKKASGNCSGSAVAQGVIPAMQDQIKEIISELEKIAGKTVKEGLRIAVTGDSISTSTNSRCPEIKVMQEDIDAGVQLGAWLTTYDALPMTLGGTQYTTADIGKYVTFVPTQEDLGKTVGNESIYNGTDIKVWWEWFNDIGVETINGTYSSGSMDSHESQSLERLRTAHGWHDSQIRRLGRRIPGTMKREAPDIIIMYRGCNDMTHSPFAKLTANYFSGLNWTYPTTDVISGGYGFKEACSIWVSKLRKAYPRAQIMFATQNNWKRIHYSKFPVDNGLYTLPEFNDAIREIADFFGCETVDFDKDGITFENMYPTYIEDSSAIPTHPNNLGHKVMGLKAIMDMDAKLNLFNLEPLKLEGKVAYQIISNMDGVTLSNSNPVYTGGTYEATLTSSAPLSSVTVKMGGVVVPNAWDSSNNTITVTNVSGDITITNTSAPSEYVTLTQNLTNATSSNTDGQLIKNFPGNVVITADPGYKIENITVTMGGTDITNSSYVYFANDAEVNISNVAADVTITATTTYVDSNYTFLKRTQGIIDKVVHTGLYAADVSRAVVKQYINSVKNSNGWGIYADLFCIVTPTSLEFGTGGSQKPTTGVVATAGNYYYMEMTGLNQDASTLNIYAGDDPQLTTVLGTANRTAAPGTSELGLLGLVYANTVASDYTCPSQSICSAKIYDTSNTLIRDYIPAQSNSSGERGVYDLITKEFAPLHDRTSSMVNVTKTLTHVTCSAGDKIPTGENHIVLSAEDGYTIDENSIVVRMSGVDITNDVCEYFVNGAEINIANVTSAISITATATLVNANYRFLKELYGQTDKYIETNLSRSQVSRIFSKIHSTAPRHNQGWGMYGYAFCNEYMNTTLDTLNFALGGTADRWTGVEIVAGNKYLANITGINTNTCTLSIYAGNDTSMADLLGSASREYANAPRTLTYCGFDQWGDAGTYETTGEPLCWSEVYDTSGNLFHNYLPAAVAATGEQGLYDTVTNTFLSFSTRQS